MEEIGGSVAGSVDNETDRSMNGNNLAPSVRYRERMSARSKKNNMAAMEEPRIGGYKPPIPVRQSITKSQFSLISAERERWKKWIQTAEEELEQYKQKSEKYRLMFEKQKQLSESRTEELLQLEEKFILLEKQCSNQECLIMNMNSEQTKLSDELKDRSNKLAETMNELNSVMTRSEDLAKKLHDFERQLQVSEKARNMELENLRSLQGSFQASEKHFSSVLEQVQDLIQENETAYQTNCKLSQEKLRVERDLNLKNKMSSSLTAELSDAQEKMKQINNTLKSFEKEKMCLFKRLQEHQTTIVRLEDQLKEKSKQTEVANQAKMDLEGQLKLANLCLSRALSGKNKANIFPKKCELPFEETHLPNELSFGSVKAFREAVAAKDEIIARLIEENSKLEDELQRYKMELQKLHEMNSVSEIWFRNNQPKDLDPEIRQRERIIDSMKLTIEKAISERNRLGLKCLRRKEQIQLLKEKNKVLEDIMLIGNRLYDEGLKKIRNIKLAQENAFGSTLSLVEIVSGSSPPTAATRQITAGNRDAQQGTSAGEDSGHRMRPSHDYDLVLNI